MAGHIATSVSQDRCTPAWILDLVREVFGDQIGLDPCSNAESITNARLAWIGPPEGTDGLKVAWPDRVQAFVNHPFGITHRHKETLVAVPASEWEQLTKAERAAYDSIPGSAWVEKCATEALERDCEVVLLTSANVDTAHWHEVIFPTAQALCLLKGRVQFLNCPASAPMPIALVYWGLAPDKFMSVFQKHGEVFTLRGLRGIEPEAA